VSCAMCRTPSALENQRGVGASPPARGFTPAPHPDPKLLEINVSDRHVRYHCENQRGVGLRPQPGVLPLHPILTPSCWRLTLNRNFGAVKAREGKAVEGFTEGIVLIL
jgi:hypothetical protein